MNKVVTDIQQASASGMTELPSRDIPTVTNNITQDEQIKPNFVPKGPEDYIEEHETSEDILRENFKMENRQGSLEYMYEELQMPILISVLYFSFQLPVVRKNLFKYVPLLFNTDGNPNLKGYVVNSLLFGSLYYVLQKGINHFAVIN